jgi:hypothetical protein
MRSSGVSAGLNLSKTFFSLSMTLRTNKLDRLPLSSLFNLKEAYPNGTSGNPDRRRRLSTVDRLVLTCLDELLLLLKTLITFFTKLCTLMRSLTVLSLPLQLVFLVTSHKYLLYYTIGLVFTKLFMAIL